MTISIAHLGPTGTYSETAALAYKNWLAKNQQQQGILSPQPSIAVALSSVVKEKVNYAVVPVENLIEGSVVITLDMLWEQTRLKILRAFTIPITHTLLSFDTSLDSISTVYSHPQALGQCQKWLESHLPQVQLIPAHSTTESLKYLKEHSHSAAIASSRAAELYQIPILRSGINDRPDNCTRFLVVGSATSNCGSYLSLAFSLPKNVPGALVKPLQIFATRNLNLSKIESRPTKRSLGEYIFFMDVEGSLKDPLVQEAIAELEQHTEVLNIFGNYDLISVLSGVRGGKET
ncbi:MAG: prephenate dehydratase [Xenococcaceae cyanobacterium MO_207.B15]|nr:prephenate dehydratase [Xenococcaceae cyanobacterium MO_207.B15]